jgi:hypothetical protein
MWLRWYLRLLWLLRLLGSLGLRLQRLRLLAHKQCHEATRRDSCCKCRVVQFHGLRVLGLLRLLWLVLLLLLSSLLLLCIDSSLPAGLESSLQCSWVGVLLLINWGVLRRRLPCTRSFQWVRGCVDVVNER